MNVLGNVKKWEQAGAELCQAQVKSKGNRTIQQKLHERVGWAGRKPSLQDLAAKAIISEGVPRKHMLSLTVVQYIAEYFFHNLFSEMSARVVERGPRMSPCGDTYPYDEQEKDELIDIVRAFSLIETDEQVLTSELGVVLRNKLPSPC